MDTARAANVDLEAFGHDMRRLMQLPDGQKVTKKFLRERMTMDQYNTARAHYGDALRQVLKQDVPDFPPQKEPTDGTPTPMSPVSETALPSASVSESNAAEGTTPTVPSASSSAPASGHAEVDQARDKLRQEALNCQIQRVEIEHILAHHDLAKARNILWKARRNTPAPTWVVAAD